MRSNQGYQECRLNWRPFAVIFIKWAFQNYIWSKVTLQVSNSYAKNKNFPQFSLITFKYETILQTAFYSLHLEGNFQTYNNKILQTRLL